MRYSKSNLRSNKRPLLRRLQRIIDKQNEDKEKSVDIKQADIKVATSSLDVFNQEKSVDIKQADIKVATSSLDVFNQEKDNIFSILPKVPKKTRIGRYNKRGNRQW